MIKRWLSKQQFTERPLNPENSIYRKALLDPHGNAVIPEGVTEIGHRVFDGSKNLRRAVVPSSVKKIGDRAFADCENLEFLELQEGLEAIASNVFTGCSSLKTLTIPDSVTDLFGWAFYDFTGLQEPVYNRSLNILYHYPINSRKPQFTVPNSVTWIHDGAFLNHPALQEVILPNGLKRIDWRAFLNCEIKSLTIPRTVEKVGSNAICRCEKLEKVTILCSLNAFETGAFSDCSKAVFYTAEGEVPYSESLRLRGIDFLAPQREVKIPNEEFWNTDSFRELANRSCQGNADDMLKLAKYYERMGDQPFFTCASNYWRYFAARYGNDEAQRWLQEWQRNHPQQRMPAALPSNHHFYASGDYLRSLGYLFFDPKRDYSVSELGEDGVVEVSSWCDDDGPDEDGFGREEYYDWWYLDAFLQPIPGISMIHSYSNLDKRINEKEFTELRKNAAETLKSFVERP